MYPASRSQWWGLFLYNDQLSGDRSLFVWSTFMKGLLTKADSIHAFETIKRNHLPGGMLGSKKEIKNFYYPDTDGGQIMHTALLSKPHFSGGALPE